MAILPQTTVASPGDPVFLDASGLLPAVDGSQLINLPSGSVLTGKTIWVDSVNGVDGTGLRGRQDKPFLTISGALAATGITAGDMVFVRPGTYSLNTTQLVVPASVALVGADSKRCQLTYSGASTVTLVTLGTGSSIAFFDILPTPSAGTTTCVAISEVTANCFRVNINAALTGNVIGLSVTATTLASTSVMAARECVFLGSGSGNSGLVVNGSSGTTRYSGTNFENVTGGGIGATVTLGTARFERCRLNGGSIGLSIANSASANAILDSATNTSSSSVGASGTLFADTFAGPIALGAQVSLTGVISPTALAANANDYNPTGLANTHTIRLSASAVVNITGLAGGMLSGIPIAPTSGRQIVLFNIGSNTITLASESSLSTNTMRFSFGGSGVTLLPGSTLALSYDGTTTRWRSLAGTGGAGGGSGTALQAQWIEVSSNQTTSTATWPLANTIITAASNGVALPTATINVASTVGFPTTGQLTIQTASGAQTITYTGTGATTFTGCSGGAGTLITGGLVSFRLRTTIAVASNGVALPTGTINVASTTGFAAAGTILVTTSNGFQLVTYTGTGATTFTGCTGGTGTMATSGLVANVTATAQDLLRLDVQTVGGALVIQSQGCASNGANNVVEFFRVVVDGIVYRGGSTRTNGGANGVTAFAVSLKITVPAGYHTIILQWRVASGTGQVRPLIAEDENASLLVQEVSS